MRCCIFSRHLVLVGSTCFWLQCRISDHFNPINLRFCCSPIAIGCRNVANHTPGCTQSSMASRSREGILPFCSTLVRPHLESWVQLWSPQHRKDMDLGERVRWRLQRWSEGWSTSPMRKCWELGLFSLEKRRLRGDLTAAFQYLKGAYGKDGENIYSRACCDRTRSDGFKLRESSIRLDRRKTFYMIRVVKHWNRLLGEVVEAPTLGTFKVRLDRALSNLI